MRRCVDRPHSNRLSRSIRRLPATGRRGAARADAAVLGVFSLLAVAFMEEGWRDPFNRWIGSDGDPQEYLWFVKWFQFALSHGRNPFVSRYVNYPFGVNLMWNTSDPALGMAAAPLTALFGPILAYNVLITSAVVLSGWAAYMAARRYTRNWGSAVVVGLVYMSSPYLLSQYQVHLSIAFVVFPPLLLLVADDLLVRQTRPWLVNALLLGVLCALQLLVSEEILALGALVAAVGALFLILFTGRPGTARLGYATKAFVMSLMVFILLAGVPLYIQFRGPERVQATGIFHPHNEFVTDLANLIMPTDVHTLAPASLVATERWTGNSLEKNGYLGVPLLVLLALVAARLRRRLLVRVLVSLVVTCTLLSLGPRLHVGGTITRIWLPWDLVDHVRVINNALPARLMLYTDLGVALLVGIFIDDLAQVPGGRRRWVGMGLAVLFGLTWMPALPAPSHTIAIPAFFRNHAHPLPPDTVALVLPYSTQEYAEPMVWQAYADLRFRMPEGYFIAANRRGEPIVGAEPSPMAEILAGFPDGTRNRATRTEAAAVLAVMRERMVTTVIVGPMPNRYQTVRFFSDLLGSPPQEIEGVELWADIRSAYR